MRRGTITHSRAAPPLPTAPPCGTIRPQAGGTYAGPRGDGWGSNDGAKGVPLPYHYDPQLKQEAGRGAKVTEQISQLLASWNEGWGLTLATILALVAFLKSMGKDLGKLMSTVWSWKGWATLSKACRRVNTLYRERLARRAMSRQMLEGLTLQVPTHVYGASLRGDPSRSTRDKLSRITPVKPVWLNDYYVATALKSLVDEKNVVRATRYSVNSWPPQPEFYDFFIVTDEESAQEEADKRETNSKCYAYQPTGLCTIPSRFDVKEYAETVSPRRTNINRTYSVKDTAPPCNLCWDVEQRDRDVHTLVDNMTKYDFAEIAPLEVTWADGELQKAIAETYIKSGRAAEVGLVRPVVKHALELRREQVARRAQGSKSEWPREEVEELIAATERFISSQCGDDVREL